MNSNLYALDIETACAAPDCTGKGCDHALVPHTARITCIGIWSPTYAVVLRDADEKLLLKALSVWLVEHPQALFVGQNFKFDLRHLALKGVRIPNDQWVHDTSLMAKCSLSKVTPEYITQYAEMRRAANDKLPRGYSHRPGSEYSLKVLAPFHLGAEPFWEDPTNHDNDIYVLKDCEYTYKLMLFFQARLAAEGMFDFYEKFQMPRCKMVLDSEIRGVTIDLKMLEQKKDDNREVLQLVRTQLDREWAPAYTKYYELQSDAVYAEYQEMKLVAMSKLKNKTPEQLLKTSNRYQDSLESAAAKVPNMMNLGSPKQVAWLLRNYFGLSIKNWEGEDSTGKAVLQGLAAKGRTDIELFLKYRAHEKLASSFFPAYKEFQNKGVIHTSINYPGTRTGRSSSDHPNLQQVKGELHPLFMARPGYKLINFDLSAIEAKLIAFYSEDPILFDIVNSGKDFHGYMCANFYFPELGLAADEFKTQAKSKRDFSKELGYSVFYGAGAPRMQFISTKRGLDWSEDKCRAALNNVKREFKGVFNFKRDVDRLALTAPIANLFGRKISYPDPQDIYMKAFNTLVQGTAGDLLYDAIYSAKQMCEDLGLEMHPLLYIHDEVLAEAPIEQAEKVAEIIKFCMTDYDLPTPLGNIKLEVEGKVSDRWEK